MCRTGTYLDYCTVCDALRHDTRRFVIECEATVAAGKVCEQLGPVVPGEVKKGFTVCAPCFKSLTTD